MEDAALMSPIVAIPGASPRSAATLLCASSELGQIDVWAAVAAPKSSVLGSSASQR
jgi:hypothetical protein